MFKMIRELKAAGHIFTDEQQVQTVIRSLSNSQKHMKLNLTHNNNIKTFADVAQHVELEEEHLISNRGTEKIFLAGSDSKGASSFKNKGKGQKWKEKSKKTKEFTHGFKKNFKGNKKSKQFKWKD